MGQRLVMINPILTTNITARLRIENNQDYVYKSFVPSTIYSVNEVGFEDLKKYKSTFVKTDSKVQQGLDLKLKHTVDKSGCSPCAKRRGIDPKLLYKYSFYTFVEVDEYGNILKTELI